MTTFTTHADSLFDAGAPILGSTGLETRDNLVATGEGASGSPSMLPNIGTNASHGAIGMPTYARYTGVGDVSAGTLVSGGSLRPTSAVWGSDGGTLTSNFQTGPALTGQWMCCGYSVDSSDLEGGAGITLARGATLWLRIKP